MTLTLIPSPPVPPPMRISVKGWWSGFKWRDLTCKEAEAYHLRCAADCALADDRFGVEEHLKSAQANYVWSSKG